VMHRQRVHRGVAQPLASKYSLKGLPRESS